MGIKTNVTLVFSAAQALLAASGGSNNNEAFGKAMDLLLTIRQQAKANKDWATSDKIRNELTAIGFDIKDTKDGAEWKLSK